MSITTPAVRNHFRLACRLLSGLRRDITNIQDSTLRMRLPSVTNETWEATRSLLIGSYSDHWKLREGKWRRSRARKVVSTFGLRPAALQAFKD